MKLLDKINNDFYKKIDFEQLSDIDKIIKDVKNEGDSALLKYGAKFNEGDFKVIDDIVVKDFEIENALKNLDKELLRAIKFSIKNVKNFARMQLKSLKPLEMRVQNSILGHKIIPIENVMCYVPGGNFSLVSSVIMNVVPAKCANVSNIYVTSPKITPEIIATAHLAGATKIFKIGGAHAISAFAYGTKTCPKVDKITGPGNKYVTYAKKYVYGECGIDFIAGPSEVLIIADKFANENFVVSDILAQCEHDSNARAYLISTDIDFAKRVIKIAQNDVKKYSPNAQIALDNSFAIVVKNIDEAIEIANKRAPEHLELMFRGYDKYIDKFKNYGSLFLGEYCAEVFGDYCSGTNHVLPTNQVARYCGGLSVFDFIKIQTYQKIDPVYAKILSENACALAKCEGLMAHYCASKLRG